MTDSEEYDSDDEEETASTSCTTVKPEPTSAAAGSDSEGSEGGGTSGEPCAICLGRMKGNIGSPEGCDHSFCLDCILEWAKVGRSRFFYIYIKLFIPVQC